jgi:cellulose synthase/poly-beta-1,6-N-acetylglucosamine synthase-like glycosyltransferase
MTAWAIGGVPSAACPACKLPRARLGIALFERLARICHVAYSSSNSQRDALEQVAPLAGPLNRTAPTVAIVVPARDEAANFRVCVSSLIAQTYPMHLLQIVVVDDHSRDETASIVATLARKYSSLVLLHSPPLPAGWTA